MMKRYLVAIFAMIMLVACQTKSVSFSLEKDGVMYSYSEMLSFYYPRDWKISKDELKLSLDIINESENEALYFDTFDINVSNVSSDLMVLYVAKLKDLGIEVQKEQQTTLSSGQECFYLEGQISKNQAKFCEVVVFIGQKQYIYSYIANKDVYEEHHDVMMNYLNSLVVNEAMKTAL